MNKDYLNNINTKRRWYDEDPAISLAINLLENTDKETQLLCAKFIKDKSHNFNIYIEENKLEDAFNYFCKRWYDEDKEIADAFEYLKLMPFELKKETALEIISKLQESEP